MKNLLGGGGTQSLALLFMVFAVTGIEFSVGDEWGPGRSALSRQCVYAAEEWKGEFDDICSKTTDSMSLAKEELKNLIARCDKLKQKIEMLDDTEKRVYLRKLKMCRDLYQFVLESKEKENPSANTSSQ